MLRGSLAAAALCLPLARGEPLRQRVLQPDASRRAASHHCGSAYYNQTRVVAKTRAFAGARGRVAYVAGLEHTGHHLWHNGVFRSLGPWHNALRGWAVSHARETGPAPRGSRSGRGAVFHRIATF